MQHHFRLYRPELPPLFPRPEGLVARGSPGVRSDHPDDGKQKEGHVVMPVIPAAAFVVAQPSHCLPTWKQVSMDQHRAGRATRSGHGLLAGV